MFGGIYLSNLRHANYTALVQADALLDEAEGLTGIRMESSDFDCDGAPEVILESRILSLFVKPSLGGMIAEIDFKPRNFNATNVLSRHKEAYHSEIADAILGTDATQATSIHTSIKAKEAGLEKHVIYDWYRHGCMIEHFLTLDALPAAEKGFNELGNFVTSAFEWGWNKEEGRLRQSCLGLVSGKNIRMTKDLSLSSETGDLKVTYSLTNESGESLRFRFASEWAFHLLAPDVPDRYYESNGQKLTWHAMNSAGSIARDARLPLGSNIRLVDEYLKLAIGIECDSTDEIVRYPIETVSMSEEGFERMFQGSIVMPIWNIELAQGAEWKTH